MQFSNIFNPHYKSIVFVDSGIEIVLGTWLL